jgi:hypothetical protein
MIQADEYKERIKGLKIALLQFLGKEGRYYGQMTRMEQSVEDLTQALNTRLDQLLLGLKNGIQEEPAADSPRERLAHRFIETATKLSAGGKVDKEMADEFEQSLDLFDIAADLERQSAMARDEAETAAIKHKRKK